MNATGTISVEIVGMDALKKEAEMLLSPYECRTITEAMFADMKEALESHIVGDVYDAYNPTKYKRRSEHEGMGVSLLESAEKATQLGQRGWIFGSEWGVGLGYEPNGMHENWEWADDISSDKLIGRIENKNPAYHFNPRKGEIPKRPFWQKFVEEMIEGGRFERVLEKELKLRKIAEPGDHITGIIRQSEDGVY